VEGSRKIYGWESFSRFHSDDWLKYTQITTKNVVIRAPAIPEITHSAENIKGKLATNHGHTVWKPTLATIPPTNPNRANIPSIFTLSLIRFTVVFN